MPERNFRGLKVVVVGYGRAGRPFAQALMALGARIVAVGEHVDSPNIRTAQDDGLMVLPVDVLELSDANLVVLTTGDTSIECVARELAEDAGKPEAMAERRKDKPFAMHLSGRFGVEPLEPLAEAGFRTVAMHPMQSFPVGASAERLRGITFGVTAGDDDGFTFANELASALGSEMIRVPNEERIRYHLASVLVSNFLPLLLGAGAKQLEGMVESEGQAWRTLLPLMNGMMRSLNERGVYDAMTGPVVRGDAGAVREHCNVIEDEDERTFYINLTSHLVKTGYSGGKINDETLAIWLEQLKNLRQSDEEQT